MRRTVAYRPYHCARARMRTDHRVRHRHHEEGTTWIIVCSAIECDGGARNFARAEGSPLLGPRYTAAQHWTQRSKDCSVQSAQW